MRQTIYLTGFMGVGKSVVGKELARLLRRPFIDLDQSIERAAGSSVAYLFASYPVERLQARVFDGNDASARVLEKLEFAYEGNLRSHILLKGKRRDVRYYARLRLEG